MDEAPTLSRDVAVRAAAYPRHPAGIPRERLEHGRYVVRFASCAADLRRVQRLRFEVFNLELGEGLEASHATGLDQDAHDEYCHHLMVEERAGGTLVGTYRMQTAAMAGPLGFYSAGEFALEELPGPVLKQGVEVGRACIAREHRQRQVLFLLWKGLAAYMEHNRCRFLFGCCSLTSQDPADGRRALAHLEATGSLHPDLRVTPRPGLACGPIGESGGPHREPEGDFRLPPLFQSYLRAGALVCGPPALDREFKTIDFLVVLDLEALAPDLRRLFF